MTGSAYAILQDACAGRCGEGGSAGYYKYGGGLEGVGARSHFRGGRRIPKSSVFACVLQCFFASARFQSNFDSRWLQKPQNAAKMVAKMAHVGAKTRPRCSKMGAKMAHVGAKLLQDGVKMAHVGAKMLQNGAKMLQDGPCWRQDASTILRDGFNMPQGRCLAPKMGQDDKTGTPNVA